MGFITQTIHLTGIFVRQGEVLVASVSQVEFRVFGTVGTIGNDWIMGRSIAKYTIVQLNPEGVLRVRAAASGAAINLHAGRLRNHPL